MNRNAYRRSIRHADDVHICNTVYPTLGQIDHRKQCRPDQMLQDAVSDQVYTVFHIVQQVLDTYKWVVK